MTVAIAPSLATRGFAPGGARTSDVAARAEVVVEETVVEVGVGLLLGADLLAGGLRLHRGGHAARVELVELRFDRRAGLAVGERLAGGAAASATGCTAAGNHSRSGGAKQSKTKRTAVHPRSHGPEVLLKRNPRNTLDFSLQQLNPCPLLSGHSRKSVARMQHLL